MPENIKNQFNSSTFNNPVFNNGGHQTPTVLTAPTASVPANFLGRTQELDEIRQLLCSQSTLVLVNAEGGMGKTTLAAAYWNKYRHEYKYLAWLYCDSGILNAIRNLLPAPLGLIEAMNTCADDYDKQVEIIKAHLASLPQDCLLVLDNVNDPEHIEGFLQYMNGLGWQVLMTSRCSKVLPNPRNEFAILHLPPEQARQLFKSNYTEETPAFEALLDRFLRAVGYNTLCIDIFSKNLYEASQVDYTFQAFIEDLERGGLILGDNSFTIRTDYTYNVRKTASTSDEIIGALYSLTKLQPEETDLMVRFALLPAENHSLALLADLIPAESKAALKRSLDSLSKRGWLTTEPAAYRISPVVQKIVLHQHATRRWELAELIVERLNKILDYAGYHPINLITAPPFAALVVGFVENLDTANDYVIMLFDRLWVYHNATGDLANALYAAERIKVIAEKFGDKYGLAVSYSKLGETHTALGNFDKALGFYEESSQLLRELYNSNPTNVAFMNGLAVSYSKLGETHAELRNLEKALNSYEVYNQLEMKLHKSDPTKVNFKNSLAISYSKLGITHTALGNLDKALGFYEAYNRLENELYKSDPTNEEFKNGLAISYERLGDTHAALGNLDKALKFYEERSQLGKELYEPRPTNVGFKSGLAISYSKIGWFYLNHRQDSATARNYYLQGLSLAQALVNDHPSIVEYQKILTWMQDALAGLDE